MKKLFLKSMDLVSNPKNVFYVESDYRNKELTKIQENKKVDPMHRIYMGNLYFH